MNGASGAPSRAPPLYRSLTAGNCQPDDHRFGYRRREFTTSPAAQPGEDRGRGETIRNEPNRRLVIAHRRARFGAQAAVRLAGVEPVLVQKLLKLAALVARQHRLLP